eukprot:14517936-Ditylum_brightwellii.AAC.1
MCISYYNTQSWYNQFKRRRDSIEAEEEDLEDLSPEEWARWEERVTVVEKKEFPYLDMKMYWENKTLQLAVYHKENQIKKYVSKESCHCTSVVKAIPAGIVTCMSRLTSLNPPN